MKVCSVCHRCFEDEVISCIEEGHSALTVIRGGTCEVVAGYTLESRIGIGRTGDLYRARRTDCGQPCLIRIVAGGAEHSEHFLREANLAAGMFHPNLVDIFEAGSLNGGEVYVVAEDTGKTLRDFLDNVGVPQLLNSIRIVRQVAEALHELHLKGLIHRAVRPENIVLTTDPDDQMLVRLQNFDFGGIGEHSVVSNKFLIDTAIDSLRYFAPEQVTGEAVSIKTDVYSLGIVFYEMLAGAPPFDAEKAAGIIEKHKNESPPEIKIDNFDLRMLVTHALTESLQKRPESRQSSANALARQLRHIEQLATHVSTPPPAVVTSASVPRRPGAAVSASPAMPIVQSVEVETSPERSDPIVFGLEHNPVIDAKAEYGLANNAANATEAPQVHFEPEPIAKVTEILELDATEAVSRRSRLKLHRKRSHSKPASPLSEISSVVVSSPAESVEPTKSEWNRSEEGIPSIAETMKVHAEDRTADTPVKPRKVEWFQPEEDVPSIAEVMRVRAQEEIVDSTVKPRKVEWSQPEEDIPSVADVVDVRAHESISEGLTITRQSESFIVQAQTQSGKIHWNQPEEDIPSVDDTREPSATVQGEMISVMGRVETGPIPRVPTRPKPPKVKRLGPGDIFPSAEAVGRFLAKSKTQLVPTEPEEITLVRAPNRRIRIEWEKNRYDPTGLPPERAFFPLIAGSSEMTNALESDPNSVFAIYSERPKNRGYMGYLSVMIGGCGVIALIALLLFGGGSTDRYVGLETTDDSAAVRPVSTERAVAPEIRQTTIMPTTTGLISPEKPVADVDRPKTVTDPDRLIVSDPRVPKPASDPIARPQSISSTLVISTINGKVRTKIEPARNSVDRRPAATPIKTDGATRPRIVKNPKP